MSTIRCECAQQLRPVETVENPCGQATTDPGRFPPPCPPLPKSLFSLSDADALWPAVLDALDLLSSRIDALEAKLISLIAIRQLKDGKFGKDEA